MAGEYERLIDGLSASRLSSEAAPDGVRNACDGFGARRPDLRDGLVNECRQVGYEASLPMSGLICRAADPADIRRGRDVDKLSVASAATFAVVASPVVSPHRGVRAEEALIDLFIGLLPSARVSLTRFANSDRRTGRPGARITAERGASKPAA